ncbi:MAG: hypothetical protein V2G33_07800 [bacterium JZ-2024 1]
MNHPMRAFACHRLFATNQPTEEDPNYMCDYRINPAPRFVDEGLSGVTQGNPEME